MILYCVKNITGTIERWMDALEANPVSVVLRSATRNAWDEREETTQVGEKNGKTTLKKFLDFMMQFKNFIVYYH